MKWLNEFDHARISGANAFLLTGSTGDVFPQYDADPKNHPRDRLDELHILCTRHLLNGNVTWIFDPARGFVFPREQDENAVAEILKGNKPVVDTSQMNSVQRAAAKVSEKPMLPNKPGEALAAMNQIFKATSVSDDKTPCIAIIPDVDVIMGRDDGMPGNAQSLLALQVIRFANSYAFQKAGHMLIMTAATTSCVDERLTRPDSPVTHVTIGRPDEQERLDYLQHVCADAASIQKRIARCDIQISTEITNIVAQARTGLDATNTEKEQHEATQETIRDNNTGYQNALKAEKKARSAARKTRRQCDRTNADKIDVIEKEIAELEDLLQSDQCATHELTDELWKNLQLDDRIRWTVITDDETIIAENLVVKLLPGNRVFLSKPLPGGRNKLYGDKAKQPVEFSMKNDWLHGRRSTDKQPRPLQKPDDDKRIQAKFERIPALQETTEKQLKEARTQLEKLTQLSVDDDPKLREALRNADDARAALEQALEAAMNDWNFKRVKIDERITELKNLLTRPESPELTRLRQEKDVLEATLASTKDDDTQLFDLTQDVVTEAARLMQGFGYRDILNILRHVRGHNETFSAKHVLDRRMHILKRSYGDLLKIVEPAYGFEGIAGLKGIKNEFTHMRDLVLRGDCKRVPQGILLMGPPGTGKTAVVEAFAQECGMLFVTIQNEKVKWVGDSEKKTDMTKQALLDLAPVVVLRDEVDQVDQGRDAHNGDSGVSNYIRRSWMEFLSRADIRGRIIVISCTNEPGLLDAALVRDQRTDERIPVLMPDAETREELFHVMAQREGFKLTIARLDPFVEATNGLSGANIQKIVRKADGFAGRRKLDYIDRQALQDAIDDFIPENRQHDIARMSLLAIRGCSSVSYLPDNVEELIAKYEKITKSGQQTGGRLADEVRKKMSEPHTM